MKGKICQTSKGRHSSFPLIFKLNKKSEFIILKIGVV